MGAHAQRLQQIKNGGKPTTFMWPYVNDEAKPRKRFFREAKPNFVYVPPKKESA